ncbi:branched-chain amino acid ABC transporter permease [Nitratireductor indicus]|uniref:branched-chain amino acid ABC transporter permease n=1 Tax=Nitratireductor indicus TaxID=721133 RepID=UPI0028765516|nr:branched-chain amino acid ABC transporter permease [Nitratireductor indicus]MDS1135150.1 branched-chain amino acid ABC transporter permease [Nitratireductor indicus]
MQQKNGAIILVCLILLSAATAGMATVPFVSMSLSFYFYLLMWVALASGLNIMAGFTGYIAFGYVAFFGIGAYTTAVLVANFGVNIYLALLGAFCVGVLASIAFSRILVLRGIYFSMVSLAIAIICRSLISNIPSHYAGGSQGISVVSVLNPNAAYFTMLALCAVMVLVSLFIKLSRFGMHLMAIKDDVEAAQVAGLNVNSLRLRAWMLSAGFGAVVGGIEAWFSSIIDPDSAFNLLVSTKAIIFAAFGGLGTVIGPIVGAVSMYVIDNFIWERYPTLNNLALGIVIILLMIFLPKGIVGSINGRWPRLRKWFV